MLGFVFYRPVSRFVPPDTVAEIVQSCRAEFRGWQAVGVFVNEPLPNINAVSEQCDLDLVQLAGEETAEYCRQLIRPAIKVLRISEGRWSAERLQRAKSGYSVERFMVDSHVAGFYGGTGVASDWSSLAGLLAGDILAGGLRPDTVATALQTTRPWGVDVSTGVEQDGRKDPGLIRQFIQAVRTFDTAICGADLQGAGGQDARSTAMAT
jgi:phosphoribosylanthranilate isomerase